MTRADLVGAQLLFHTQQLVLEACMSASSARVLEIPVTEGLSGAQSQESMASSVKTPPSGGDFLSALDAAVSDSLDTHARRMIEIDTNEANTTSWIIQPHHRDGAQLSTSELSHFSREAHASGGRHNCSRALHALSEEEVCAALQIAATTTNVPSPPLSVPIAQNAASSAEFDAVKSTLLSNIGSVTLNDDAQKNTVLVLGDVCNKVSSRLHYAQLRLHIFRQSLSQGGAPSQQTAK